jgi:hypothetical protein
MRPLAIALLLSYSRLVLAQVQVMPMPPPPPTDPASTEDVVTLRDGTILRGHVTELKPNDHVELVLLDGRTETVQWVDIAKSEGPAFPLVKHNPAERFLQPSPGRVPLLIESRRPLTVGVLRSPAIGQSSLTIDEDGDVSQLTVDYQARGGVVVCTATPCHIYARPGPLKLQASGEDVVSYSSELTVPPNGARVKLRSPSAHQMRLGLALFSGSISLLVGGGVLVGLGAATGRSFDPATTAQTDNSSLYYGLGGAALGVGGVMLIAGVVLDASSRRGIDSVTPLDGALHF